MDPPEDDGLIKVLQPPYTIRVQAIKTFHVLMHRLRAELATQLPVWLTTVALGALLVLTYLTWLNILKIDAREKYQESQSERMASEIDRLILSRFPSDARRLALNQQVIDLAEGRTSPDNPDILLVLNTARHISGASIVYLMDSQGKVIGCTPFDGGQTLTGESYPFRPYFTFAIKGRESIYPALGVTTGIRGLYFSSPIRMSGKADPIGVLVFKVGLESVDDALRKESQPTALLSPNGVVFAANRQEWLFKVALPSTKEELVEIEATLQFAHQGLSPLATMFDKDAIAVDNIEYGVHVSNISISGWKIATFMRKDREYPIPLRQRMTFTLTMSFLVGLSITVHFLLINISKRKVTERVLRESEERLRIVLESNPDPVIFHNLEGKVFYLNPSFEKTFGWKISECEGKKIDYFIPTDCLPDNNRMIGELLSGQRVSSMETKRYSKDWRVIAVSVSSGLFRDSQGNVIGIVSNLRDITEKQLMEAELRQAQKMEIIGTLTGGIAHDFNNILQTVGGYSQLLKLKGPYQEPQATYMSQIEHAVGRATDLVRRIMSFSRKVVPIPEPMNLNDAVAHTAQMLERIFPKTIQILTQLDDDIDMVNADARQMEQVLVNLLTNCRDAMPEGGNITIRTKNLSLDENSFREYIVDAPGNYVMAQVIDSGHGMDENTLANIFKPFFTTKAVGEGTGLGLSVVQDIIKGHGGSIICHSKLGQGTTFTICLKALADKAMEAHASPLEEEEIRGGEETILMVDDEEAIRGMGQEMLTMYGYHVETAPSGERAFEIIQQRDGNVDLVILDLGLPGWGGYKTLEQITKNYPNLKVIIASGYSTDLKQAEDCLRAGACHYITKPYKLNDLLAIIRMVLDEKKNLG